MEDQGTVKVKFPRETDTKSGWAIDPSFIARVRHSIQPDEDEWVPSHEEVQAVLLAIECIPAGIFTKPKQSLTYEHKQAMRLYKAVERLALQAGEDADESVDWLCGEHGGLFKLYEAYFSPKQNGAGPVSKKGRAVIDAIEAAHGITKGQA